MDLKDPDPPHLGRKCASKPPEGGSYRKAPQLFHKAGGDPCHSTLGGQEDVDASAAGRWGRAAGTHRPEVGERTPGLEVVAQARCPPTLIKGSGASALAAAHAPCAEQPAPSLDSSWATGRARAGPVPTPTPSHSALPGPASEGARGRGRPRPAARAPPAPLPRARGRGPPAPPRPAPSLSAGAQVRHRRGAPAPRPAPLEPREGALPGQVCGVSAQGQQEPTAAQRPRGPVGPAATPCAARPA